MTKQSRLSYLNALKKPAISWLFFNADALTAYRFLGGIMSVIVPSFNSAAKQTVSDSVGWA
jgi:hypothetical protein